ncbi:ankyrin repeat domain-containing protein [Candidatus Dependentiae bacterium]
MFKSISKKTVFVSTFAFVSLFAGSLSFAGSDLFDAIRENNLKKFKRLVKEEVNINKAYGWDYDVTLLYYACHHKRLEMVKELLKHPKIDVNKAPEYGRDKGFSSLCLACERGYLKIVIELLKHNQIDVNKADFCGRTPLYCACVGCNSRIIGELLKHPGIDVDKAGEYCETIFLIACEEGLLGVVKKLLRRKDIKGIANRINKEGKIPLSILIAKYLKAKNVKIGGNMSTHLVNECSSGDLYMIKLLVECGADLNSKNGIELSVMDIALIKSKYDFVEYFIEKNAPVYGNKEKYLFDAIENLRENANLKLKIIGYLVKQGVDLKAKNNNGKSFLDCLFSKYKMSNISDPFVNLLMKHYGIIYDSPEKYIKKAVKNGKTNIVKFLVKSGLNFDFGFKVDGKFVNIIQISKRNNKKEVTQYLEKIFEGQIGILKLKDNIRQLLSQIKNLSKKDVLPCMKSKLKEFKELFEKSFFKVFGESFVQKTRGQFFRIPDEDNFIDSVEQSKKKYKKSIKIFVDKMKKKIKIDAENIPSSAIQEVLSMLFELHKKYPDIVVVYDLKNFLKLIPFNKIFLLLVKFKNIRNFIAKCFGIKDSFNLTIDEACIIYLKDGDTMNQVISHRFSNSSWYKTSKQQLIKWLNTGNAQNSDLLEKLAYAKKIKNKKFYRNLFNMAYLKCLLAKGQLPPEIVANIAGFLSEKELSKIGRALLEKKK